MSDSVSLSSLSSVMSEYAGVFGPGETVLGIFAGVGEGVLINLSFIISGSGYCTVG